MSGEIISTLNIVSWEISDKSVYIIVKYHCNKWQHQQQQKLLLPYCYLYYADLEKFQFKKMCILCFVFSKFFKFSVIIQVIFMSAITMFCIYILIKHHLSFLPIYRYICLIFHIFSRKIKCIGRVQSSTR